MKKVYLLIALFAIASVVNAQFIENPPGTLTTSDNIDTNGTLRWGTGTTTAWGDGHLSLQSGWGASNSYPTIGSVGGSVGSLIMLHNPHIPFRTENHAPGFSGRAGLRLAVDSKVSKWWDVGLAGDFFHIYRGGSGELFRISNSGNVGIGLNNPSEKLDVEGNLRWGTGSISAWGDGHLSLQSGWGSSNRYPTIGSIGGSVGSLIMLHNPHVPFRTENHAPGFSGRAGLRLAADSKVSNWWDVGLAGDFFHIYRGNSGELFRITNSGRIGIGTSEPAGGLHFISSAKQANAVSDGIAFLRTLGDDYSLQITSAGGIPHLDFANESNEDYDIRLGIYNDKQLAILGGSVGIGLNNPSEKLDIEGNLRWGTGSSKAWGDGHLSLQSGWGSSNSHPTLGSIGGSSGSLIMLHNPHTPFRTDNAAPGFSGRAGLRLATDQEASNWWDVGLAGDFFHIYRKGSGEFLRVTNSGSVGIGTSTTGSHKLAVEGSIGARSIKVEIGDWSDFVFYDDYKLRPLEEVESFIAKNNHLPEIPSEDEVTKNGIDIGEMNAKLLQKIEELTLYMIEQNKQNQAQQTEIEELKRMNIELLQKLESK